MNLTQISGEDGRSVEPNQNRMIWQASAVDVCETPSAFKSATVTVS